MKKIFISFFSFIFAFILYFVIVPNSSIIQADVASCQSQGGECKNLNCPVGYEYVYDSGGFAITCSNQEVCCKLIPDPNNLCVSAGGECFRSAPNPTLYTPRSEPCPDTNQSCYEMISAVSPCASPGICTSAPSGQCPSGTKLVSGLCSGYQQLCCTEPTTTKKTFPTCSTKNGEGIDTAIGCIPIEDSNALIGFILKWAIGVGGGIAFLLIIVAGFQITTSAGNPDKVKAGQELMTSAIAGLLLLIFSVFILRIIGVNILEIFPKQ